MPLVEGCTGDQAQSQAGTANSRGTLVRSTTAKPGTVLKYSYIDAYGQR